MTGAMRYVLGGGGGAGKALLLGGVAYALLESLSKGSGTGVGSALPQSPSAGGVPAGSALDRSLVVPPPLPKAVASASSARAAIPPPLPAAATRAEEGPPTADQAIPPELLRVIRLSISAAQADGVLTSAERQAILSQARAVGAEAAIARDLLAPAPPAEILPGVADSTQRRQLYTIAFAIVRADEDVTPLERRYLDEVARALDLDANTTAALEAEAVAGIQKELL
jgi:hypothetical protein